MKYVSHIITKNLKGVTTLSLAVLLLILISVNANAQWTSTGTITAQTSTTDDLLIGGSTMTGSGIKCFWDYGKGAFRGGYLSTAGGNNWDTDSIGTYSFGFGNTVKATGDFGATAIGNYTTASGNSGATALGVSTIASGNSGATALGENTSATGNSGATALGRLTTASGNFGATALGYNTTASGNHGATALGENTLASGFQGATALGLNTRASGNQGATALGYQTTASGTLGATALGFATEAAGSESICIGSGDFTGNKLINNIDQSLMIGFNSAVPTFFVGPSLSTTTSGKVGIGTTAPTHDLHIAGDVAVAGQIVHPSDINLKENISSITNGLSTINQLSPKSYTHKTDKAEEFGLSTKLQYGLIAQEVEEVLPELVIQKALVGEDGEIYKGLNYEKLIPILVAALQEASAKVETLEAKNETQNEKIKVLMQFMESQKLSGLSGSK